MVLLIAAWLILIVVTFLWNLLGQWFGMLDQVLKADFFATLAGLSLAAASFLVTGIEQSRSRVNTAISARDQAREYARKSSQFVDACKWYEKDHPSADAIERSLYVTDVKTFLLRWHEVDELQHPIAMMETGKRRFIASFYFLAAGLVEALTLDLWADSASSFTGLPANLSQLPAFLLVHIVEFLDVFIAGSIIVYSIYNLAMGARAFNLRSKEGGA